MHEDDKKIVEVNPARAGMILGSPFSVMKKGR